MAFAMAAGNRVLGGGEVARPCLVADRSLCSELVRAEAGQRGGDGADDDGADDVSDDDDGAGDGAGEDRAIEPEGPGLGDQHGLGTCAEAETSVSTAWVGAGSMQSAPLRATPGKAQKRAAGLLLTSVGWARPRRHGQRRARHARRPKPVAEAGRRRPVLAEAAPTYVCT